MHPTRTLDALARPFRSSPRNLLTDGRPPRSSRSPCSAPILRDACGVARAEDAIGGKPSLSPSCRRPGHFSNSCAAVAGVAPSLRPSLASRPRVHRRPTFQTPLLSSSPSSSWPLSPAKSTSARSRFLHARRLAQRPRAPPHVYRRRASRRRPVHRSQRFRARRTPPPPFVSRPSRRRPSSSVASSPGRSSAIPNVASVASTFTLPSSSVGTAGTSRELDAASSRAGALDAHPMASPPSASPTTTTVSERTDRSMNRAIDDTPRRRRRARRANARGRPPCTSTSPSTRAEREQRADGARITQSVSTRRPGAHAQGRGAGARARASIRRIRRVVVESDRRRGDLDVVHATVPADDGGNRGRGSETRARCAPALHEHGGCFEAREAREESKGDEG